MGIAQQTEFNYHVNPLFMCVKSLSVCLSLCPSNHPSILSFQHPPAAPWLLRWCFYLCTLDDLITTRIDGQSTRARVKRKTRRRRMNRQKRVRRRRPFNLLLEHDKGELQNGRADGGKVRIVITGIFNLLCQRSLVRRPPSANQRVMKVVAAVTEDCNT